MNPFFITGLPQSRTTWLANWLTSGTVFCHHDLLGEVKDMAQFYAAMELEGARHVGDSDSGLLAVYSQVNERFAEAPWVLVEREFEEAWESLCGFVNSGPWAGDLACSWELHEAMRVAWQRDRQPIIENPRCMVVSFESLNRIDQLELIWRHCVPGQRFDARRARALQSYAVRPHQARVPIRAAFSIVQEARKLWPSGQAS